MIGCWYCCWWSTGGSGGGEAADCDFAGFSGGGVV
jgi:hypothetical protein